MREYSYSCLRDALEDKNHNIFVAQRTGNVPDYVMEDNIIYKYFYVYGKGRIWLDKQSPLFKENEYKFYVPVATKRGDLQVGYLWERANMSNYLLKNQNSVNLWQPYLKWCDIGNHPYPKEIRHYERYRERIHNKFSDMLIYPDPDITKAVRFPSLLDIAL